MSDKPPVVVVEGIETVIERDLEKHKTILARTIGEVQAFKHGRSYEMQRKKHLAALVGGGKYNDAALQVAIDQCVVNIQHMTDKVTMGEEQIKFNARIVDTLTAQLKTQHNALGLLAAYRRRNGPGY